jgi:hypothetical protein
MMIIMEVTMLIMTIPKEAEELAAIVIQEEVVEPVFLAK